MNFIYKMLNAIHRWATTDPTPEQRAAEISRKTTVGQWEKLFHPDGTSRRGCDCGSCETRAILNDPETMAAIAEAELEMQ